MTGDDDIDRDGAQIAEYALHLLSPEERAEVENRLDLDGAARAELRIWEESLATLAAEIPPVAPPATLRARLERGTAAVAVDDAPPRPARRRFWRLAGAALLAGLAVYAVLPVSEPPAANPWRAELATADGSVIVTAEYRPASGELLVDRRGGVAAPGRALELWAIPRDQATPISLGVLPDDPSAVLPVDAELAAAMVGPTLAVSDEPAGGSPTGAPTGPVLATGPAVPL